MNLGKEDEHQEFKESLSQLNKGLKSITAMLNRHGEAIYRIHMMAAIIIEMSLQMNKLRMIS